jgi:hypothetical protein
MQMNESGVPQLNALDLALAQWHQESQELYQATLEGYIQQLAKQQLEQ